MSVCNYDMLVLAPVMWIRYLQEILLFLRFPMFNLNAHMYGCRSYTNSPVAVRSSENVDGMTGETTPSSSENGSSAKVPLKDIICR